MAGDVHHVIDAAEQPEVAVLVNARTVADEIRVLEAAPVGLLVTLGVAVDAAQHRRPRLADHQVPTASGRNLFAGVVVNGGIDGGEGLGRRARLEDGDARQRRDQDHAGLGLPPGVDHRRSVAANVLAIPDPRLRVDRLADGAQHAQRAQVVLGGILGPPLHVRADRGRCGVEDVGPVPLDDLPPAVLVGEVGRALVDDAGRPIGERPEDDVAVASHPADVGRAPVNGVGLDVEDVVVRARRADHVAGGGVDDPLRLGGGAARVEQVEQVLRIHRLAGARLGVVAHAVEHVVCPDVAALLHVDLSTRAFDHDACLEGG